MLTNLCGPLTANKLRLLLSQAPVLAHSNFKNAFTLDTDASDTGIGAVLSRIGEDGKEHVIAYGSRLLTKPECKYCVTRKELLAVVYFIAKYRPYLLGQKAAKHPKGQLARWMGVRVHHRAHARKKSH